MDYLTTSPIVLIGASLLVALVVDEIFDWIAYMMSS